MGRSEGNCYVCGENKELVSHQKTDEFTSGDPDRGLCAKCYMRGRQPLASTILCRRIKALASAFVAVEAVKRMAAAEDQHRFQHMLTELLGMINCCSLITKDLNGEAAVDTNKTIETPDLSFQEPPTENDLAEDPGLATDSDSESPIPASQQTD